MMMNFFYMLLHAQIKIKLFLKVKQQYNYFSIILKNIFEEFFFSSYLKKRKSIRNIFVLFSLE